MELVEIHLCFAAGEVTIAEIVQLQRQLGSEPELRGRVRRSASDGTLAGLEGSTGSGTVELLAVSLAGGGAIRALLTALPSLLRAMRSPTTVEVTTPDGRTAKITAESAEEARVLLESALRDHGRQG